MSHHDDHAVFCDMWILSNVNLKPNLHKEMNSLQEASKITLTKKGGFTESLNDDRKYHTDNVNKLLTYYTHLDELAPYLTGFGRKICYNVYGYLLGEKNKKIFSPYVDYSKNKMVSIHEGEFSKGLLEGYGRKISVDGTAEVGYFIQDLPYGKFMVYRNG